MAFSKGGQGKLRQRQRAEPQAGRAAARLGVTRAHADIMLLGKAGVWDTVKQVKFLSLKTISVLFQEKAKGKN